MISDVGKAEAALRAAKIRCGREEAISVSLKNRPGALAEAAKKISAGRGEHQERVCHHRLRGADSDYRDRFQSFEGARGSRRIEAKLTSRVKGRGCHMGRPPFGFG